MGTHEVPAYIEKCEGITEQQANYLSSAILMPIGQVKKCYSQLYSQLESKYDIISKMAEIFEVSKQAMKIRLELLKII